MPECLAALLNLAVILVFSAMLSYAQTAAATTLNTFGGINNYIDSAKIDDADAQYSQNVLTDGGKIETIPGNIRFGQVLNGHSITHLNEFIDSSNTRHLMAQSSSTIYSVNSAGVATAINSVSSGSVVDSVQAFGKIYFTDGVDVPFWYDGTSTGVATGMPLCKYTEFANERLYCANTSTETNKLYISSYTTPTSWGIPIVTTDLIPVQVFWDKDNGEALTCLKKTQFGVVLGKRHSLYIMKGNSATTFYKKTISNTIGCVDDKSIQEANGLITFLGVDGVYQWDGGTGEPVNISRTIDPTIKSVNQSNSYASSWLTNTQGQWQSGSYDANLWLATSTNTLKIQDINWNNIGFEWNTSTSTLTNWTKTGTNFWRTFSMNLGVYGGSIAVANCDGGNMSVCVAIGYNQAFIQIDGGSFIDTGLTVYNTEFLGYRCSGSSMSYDLSSASSFRLKVYTNDGDYIISDTVTLPSGSKTLISYCNALGNHPTYADFALLADLSSSTYYSQVNNLGVVGSFSDFVVSSTATETNTAKYYVRASSTVFLSTAVSPSWTLQTPNSAILISTNPYVQFRIDSLISSSSQTLTVNYVLWNYYIGTQSPATASLFYDGRYFLSVSTGNSASNNLCLVLMRNQRWGQIVGPAYGAMCLYNSLPLVGDGSSDSYLWEIMRPSVYAFDSSPIDAIWVSKDFTFGGTNLNKSANKLWIDVEQNAYSTMTISCMIDRNGTYTDKNFDLNQTQYIMKEVPGMFDGYSTGKFFRFKFETNGLNQYYKLNGYSVYYNVYPLSD